MRKKSLFVLLIIMIFALPGFAMFKIPEPVGYVNDFANVIENNEEAKLNSIILELKQKTGAEIAVVTLNSLEGYPIEDVSLKIGRQWKVGQKGKNNGVVILVVPNERKMRIETGYGIEGIIPDSKAGRIRDEYMIPYFKENQYGTGIILGTSAIVGAIAEDYGVTLSGNYNYQQYRKSRSSGQGGSPFDFIFIIILIIFAIRHPRLAMLLLLSSGRGGGRSYGGGSFGGFSGGGGFGGGGASGGW